MKKLLVLAFASVTFIYAASLYAADIKFAGDFRVRTIYADDLDANEVADDQTAFADGRFRLKTTATAGMTSGVVVLDFTNAFVNPGTGTATGNYRLGTVNLGSSWGIVGVREAYLALDLNMVKVAVGRKPFKLGHSLVLDDTLDTIAAKFMAGPLDVVLADGILADTNAGGVAGRTGSDTDLYIAKAGLKHGDDHALGLFVTYLKDRGESFVGTPLTRGETTLWGLGATADGTFGPVMLNLEVDLFNGEIDDTGATPAATTDLEGMNALAGAGLKAGMADLNVWLLYTTGEEANKPTETNVNGISGNFVLGNILINDNINSDRDGQCASVGGKRIGFGGASCVGGLGVTGVKLGAGYQHKKNCHVDVAAIWAQTTEDPINAVTGVAGDSDLGLEIDANMHHKLDDNVMVVVNLGYLLSGDAWKTLGANSTTGANGPADNQLKGIVSLNYMF